MTWPFDGDPRYVVGEISGKDPSVRGKGGTPPEFYVYDRADCHRIVYRTAGHSHRPSVGRARAASRCDALNAADQAQEVA